MLSGVTPDPVEIQILENLSVFPLIWLVMKKRKTVMHTNDVIPVYVL